MEVLRRARMHWLQGSLQVRNVLWRQTPQPIAPVFNSSSPPLHFSGDIFSSIYKALL